MERAYFLLKRPLKKRKKKEVLLAILIQRWKIVIDKTQAKE